MPPLLRTERKYNLRYNQYAIPAYTLMSMSVIICLRAMWAIITQNNYIFWFIIFLVYSLFFYIIIPILGKGIKNNDNSYGAGYVVEEMVGTKLAALGNDYKVIHDILKGKDQGNIDHVVIGPTGIFVIESKANQNKMVYYQNNIRKLSDLGEKFMNQVASNALWVHNIVKERLGIDEFVHGVVVRPLNEDKKIETHCVNKVCIMDGNSVYDYIKNFSGRLSVNEINNMHSVLCEIKRNSDRKL